MKKFLAGLIASLLFFASAEAYAPEGQLYVTMLNVGQGDSILIETPTQNVLIDTGDVSEQERLKAELQAAGVTRFERIILTHPHADHIGGIGFILDNYEVDEISDNGLFSASPLYKRYHDSGVKVTRLREGNSVDFGGDVRFDVLSPTFYDQDMNNNSIVGKLVFKDFSMLFMGDAEKQIEEELLDTQDVTADILKAGHHGSKTSNTEDFIGAVRPKVILISAGEGNRFGHPHKAALSNMRTFCSDIFCTRFNGSIKVVSDGNSFDVYCENQADWLESYTGERVTITRI